MSKKTQIKKMRDLAALSRKNLGHIYGDEKGFAQGEKKVWLNTGKAFLRALAKDLGFLDAKVWSNPGGIAVNGESMLMGMWNKTSGIYINLCKETCGCGCVLYRSIQHIKDSTCDRNNWYRSSTLANGDYDGFIAALISLKVDSAEDEKKIAG